MGTLYRHLGIAKVCELTPDGLGLLVSCYLQGIYCTGKTGKMVKEIPCQGKHRKLRNFGKTQRIWFAQVVNSLILKVKDISIFAANKLVKFAKSILCM